ncbi:MAG: S41 family peptidase [Flavobacteriaceae bacterium]|nr:S41 family peptidase [Flavobacteriaceae bacterium]
MKKIITLILTIFLLTNLINCTEKEDIPKNTEVQNFIWKALNLYYLWQTEIPDLQNDRFNDQNDLTNFIENKTPESLFDELLFTEDRFSWIVDDYIALENLFAGTTKNNGMEFGIVEIATNAEQVFGYIRYIIPNSDAQTNGLQRGQIIYGINGTQLTRNNFRSLLFTEDTYTIDFGTFSIVDDVAQVIANGQHITLTKEELTENPVHTFTINEIDGRKIGYLLYNQFTNEFDADLNNAFLQFKNENVTDLVLDLRYNGGGSVNTAVSLASMITGQFTNELFTTLTYNEKLSEIFDIQNRNFKSNIATGQAINHLNLDKLYVLVTGSTASASELIINGLNPYIEVQLIGTQTTGKSVGSITLYDSENYNREGANSNHTYAIQPIVTELVNKLGENNHIGFIPDIILSENYANLGILGTINEPLFAVAIAEITANRSAVPTTISLQNISNSKTHNAQNNMFIDLK